MTDTTASAPRGAFRLGGVVFRWQGLQGDGFDAWVGVGPERPDDSGSPEPSWEQGFLDLAAEHAHDDAVRVLSPWMVFHTEFEWPVEAASCGCLERHGFGEVARALNGGALVASPGPVFDRFLLKAELVDRLIQGDPDSTGVHDVTSRLWAEVVGLDHAFYAPGHPDYSAPTTLMRQALGSNQAGEAHEAYLRAFDSYYFGGLPTLLAQENKRAYLENVEAREGYDYAEREVPGVTRRLLTVNSLIMRTSLCCTSIDVRGAKMFASRLERIAESTTFA